MRRTKKVYRHTVEADVMVFKPIQYRNIDQITMLKEARKLLRGRWTQGSNALNAQGLPVPPISPLAVQFCLRGACIRVLNPTYNVLVTDLHVETSAISRMIANALGYHSSSYLVQWNDTQERTEEEVIALIEERIRILKLEKRDAQLSATDRQED